MPRFARRHGLEATPRESVLARHGGPGGPGGPGGRARRPRGRAGAGRPWHAPRATPRRRPPRPSELAWAGAGRRAALAGVGCRPRSSRPATGTRRGVGCSGRPRQKSRARVRDGEQLEHRSGLSTGRGTASHAVTSWTSLTNDSSGPDPRHAPRRRSPRPRRVREPTRPTKSHVETRHGPAGAVGSRVRSDLWHLIFGEPTGSSEVALTQSLVRRVEALPTSLMSVTSSCTLVTDDLPSVEAAD